MNEFAKGLAQITKGGKRGLPKYFDLSDPLQRSVVSDYFGGEELMQEQYPRLYKSYCRAAEQGLGEVSYEGFCDGAVIYRSQYNHETGKIEAAGRTNFTGRVRHAFISINVMQGEKIIKQYNEAHSNCSMADIKCETNPITEDLMNMDYVVNLFVAWEEAGENEKLKCMAAGTHEINLSNEISFNDAVTEMTLYHPTKKIGGIHKEYSNHDEVDLKEIIVAYDRYVSSNTVDYEYRSKTVNGQKKIYLDVLYSFLLNKDFTFKQNGSITACLLCDQMGTVFYNGTDAIITTSAENKQEIKVQLSQDWGTVIPESVISGNRVYRLFLQHDMYLIKGGRNFSYTVTVSNLDYKNSGSNNEIVAANLHMYWGCLAAGTKILMSDGSEREIQTLQAGDKLLNSKGESVEIREVITGDEKYIYRTYTESGKLVSASLLHPFAAEQGDLLLRDFNYKTRLKVKDNGQYVYETVINCYPEEYDGKVYSLELEDTGKEKTIIADGFVTYDNSEVERISKENYIPENVVLSDEELQEFDKLKGMLEKRNSEYGLGGK